MEAFPLHPYSEIFPLDEGPSMWALREDIKENGQRDKITLWNGSVLDGRRRQVCCLGQGITPLYEKFEGTDAEALALVVSRNLHRRHLSVADRAMVGAKIAKLPHGTNQHKVEDPPRGGSSPMTRTEAAEALDISERSIDRAKVITENGIPELAPAVSEGLFGLQEGAQVAEQPPAQQKKILNHRRSNGRLAEEPESRHGTGEWFDWKKEIEEPFGKLVRGVENCRRSYGRKAMYQAVKDILDPLAEAIALWKETVVKHQKEK